MIRVAGNQTSGTGLRQRLQNQDGGSAGVLHFRRVLRIGEEGKLSGTGLLQPGDPGDVDIPVASKFAAQPGGQIAQQYAVDGFHGDGLIVDGR